VIPDQLITRLTRALNARTAALSTAFREQSLSRSRRVVDVMLPASEALR
jgi:hypothetical protein